ncbi:MAG: ribonuclease E/G [Agathobacter sp.]|nr:ribonuclease E/G [Agathobacter sp.]
MNRLAITRVAIKEKSNKKHLAYIMLDEKRNFVDFQVFQEEDSLLNSIFVARVDNIVPNIKGAFVRISPKQVCYLSLEDIKSPLYVKKQSKRKNLSIGDEIVVQVVKDAVKTKEPVVSTKLTIAGKYCVLTTDNISLGVSKKITGENYFQLSELLRTHVGEKSTEYGFGMIIRTNALEATEKELRNDIEETVSRFIELKENSVHQCAFAVLQKSDAPYVQKLKSADLSSLDAIFTDEENIFAEIENKLPYLKDKGLLKLYRDDKVSLGTLYNFRGSLDKLIEKRVWLKSGANIIIEQLETMTVIDINSGKNISKNETAILEINKEAAIEIARQLRLRNISGMIIIDFINMKSKAYMDELVALLKEQIKKDPVTCTFMDVTKLGLIELTRKKTYKSLKEQIE